MLVIDERIMISAESIAKMDEHAKKVAYQGTHSNEDFGGIPIVLLVGDDCQLPPIKPGASSAISYIESLNNKKKAET